MNALKQRSVGVLLAIGALFGGSVVAPPTAQAAEITCGPARARDGVTIQACSVRTGPWFQSRVTVWSAGYLEIDDVQMGPSQYYVNRSKAGAPFWKLGKTSLGLPDRSTVIVMWGPTIRVAPGYAQVKIDRITVFPKSYYKPTIPAGPYWSPTVRVG